jgi:PAS domain S-box-containing protein
LSIRGKLIGAFVAIMIPLVLVGSFSYAGSKQLIQSNRQVSHTQQVLGATERFLRATFAMEAAARGYMAGQQEIFRAAYRDRRSEALQSLTPVRTLTADNPGQQERLRQVGLLLDKKIGVMDSMVETRERGSTAPLVDDLLVSRRLTLEIEKLTSAISQEEKGLLEERQTRANRQATLNQQVILLGTAATLLVALVMTFLFTNLIATRISTLIIGAERLRAGDLSTRVDVGQGRRHEFGKLASAFNRMADDLQTRDEQLKASEEERDRFFRMALDMMGIAGFDGYFKRANPALTGTLGYTVEEFQSRPFMDFVHPEDQASTTAAMESLVAGHSVIDFENRYRCKDSSYRWMAWKAVSDTGAGLVYATARDITEQKSLQQERQGNLNRIEEQNRELEQRNHEVEHATQMKSQFLASMSHELRTPLNAIMGFSELLEDQNPGPLNEKQTRFVSHIRTGARHLLQLINDILDLSKIEAGQLEMHSEDFQLASAVPEVMSLIRPLAMTKRVRLELAPPDQSLMVHADRVRVKQVLYNLLSNAVKFTPEGGQITVEVVRRNNLPALVVRDTGVGIRPEELDGVFEEFRQVGEESAKQQGTGLGLAITRRLVEIQSGKIFVESEFGTGSRFIVLLAPAHGVVSGLPTALNAEDERVAPGRAKPLLLVIDDDPLARQLLVSSLTPEGYDVRSTEGGPNALDLACELQPDAITLDVLMPLSGWKILGDLKRDPRTALIPIIVVSILDQKSTGFALGAADYLVKPVSREALVRALRRQLAPVARPQRILVIDDNPHDLQLVSELLGSVGFQPLHADGGKQGLLMAREQSPDAVLLDLMMPEVDGFEVLRNMKQDNALRSIPVFILTAKDLSSEETEVLSREAQALLRKSGPWKEDLLLRLRRTLITRNGAPAC